MGLLQESGIIIPGTFLNTRVSLFYLLNSENIHRSRLTTHNNQILLSTLERKLNRVTGYLKFQALLNCFQCFRFFQLEREPEICCWCFRDVVAIHQQDHVGGCASFYLERAKIQSAFPGHTDHRADNMASGQEFYHSLPKAKVILFLSLSVYVERQNLM